MKASKRYVIFWRSAVAVAFLAMAYLIIPPLIPMSGFRRDFAAALAAETGAPVEILGDVKLSMLGYPMLSARDVRFGETSVKSVRFRISWGSVFDLAKASIISGIKVSGLETDLKSLAVPNFGKKILVSDSLVRFGKREFEIIDGVLDSGKLSASVRTGRHKYSIDVSGGDFMIRNRNEGLLISGRLTADESGEISASGTFQIDTKDANRWFGFPFPEIKGETKLSMNFDWDGKGFLDLSKIAGTNGKASFGGRVRIWGKDGRQIKKSVRMHIENADMDLSFLKDHTGFLYNSEFNVAIDGNIATPFGQIESLRSLSVVSASGSDSEIDFKMLKADGENLSASASGKIIGARAENLDISFYRGSPEQSVRCMFFGNRENWKCGRWSAAGKDMTASGSLSVSKDRFQMTFNSENATPDLGFLDAIEKHAGGRDGVVEFAVGNLAGVAEIRNGQRRAEYIHKNTTLGPLPTDLPLPESMKRTPGNLAAEIRDGRMSFSFQTEDWSLSVDDGGGFSINHRNAKKLLAALTGKPELPFVKNNVPAIVAGKYDKPFVTDLRVRLADMQFSGMAGYNGISLKTDMLNLDEILDGKWFGDFIDNQYLAADPLLAPFDFGTNLSITADAIILNGAAYKGFIYSLDNASQKMSISDSERGRLLLSVSKDKSRYKYLIQLNKFFVQGKLFGEGMPVNLEKTTVTAQAELESMGLTAYDVRRNMTGIVDASLDGGTLSGLGTDGFYDNANRYGKSDTEDALRRALEAGETEVKEIEITGEYSGGDFRTTKPFLLTARHTDVTGNLSIKNDSVRIRANITLRGTSPIPKPLALTIENGEREYSLSDILPDIDLDYLREFVRTHKKF
ncbi:MAG: hypothetical protein LBL21_02440 [Rickettsiales bacterium]|jgi:hypothetical protein|nr:hypothetical protein [Rickettsiales bacterium]